MCVTSLGQCHLVNTYGVKAGWFILFVDKPVGVTIPLTRVIIPERIRGGYQYDDPLHKSMFTLLSLRRRRSFSSRPTGAVGLR